MSVDLMKENDFKMTKEKSRRYPAQRNTNVDYADDIVLLANTPALAEILLRSLKREAGDIGLHFNADKTEYMCFNQTVTFSTLNSRPLKVHLQKKQYLIHRERHPQ